MYSPEPSYLFLA